MGALVEPLLTPSKITAWLECAHYLTLRQEVETGVRAPAPQVFGEMARMLLEKGLAHERQVLARYAAAGREVFEVPQRRDGESFTSWVDRVGDVLAQGHDVVYQMPLAHQGIRGIADFLERVDGGDGTFTYEPVDAKLARTAAKPGHVLQLCFYAEAIGARRGTGPKQLHLELGSGDRETIRVEDVLAYWRRQRRRLAALIDVPALEATRPLPCDHCAFCEFERVCEAEWRSADSLVHVAGLRRADQLVLESDGVTTIAALAPLDRDVPNLDPGRSKRLVRQAALQVQAREAPPGTSPPYELLPTGTLQDEVPDGIPLGGAGSALTGFAALPEPDDGDVFLDFEGHPFWRADVGLFFLFGLIEREDEAWVYRASWAHDKAAEAKATAELVRYLTDRRRRFPGMHVYHYNHTERTGLTRLAGDHAVAELELEQLVTTGAFVDLFPIVTGAVQVGAESYGLKHIERLTDFQRSHTIDHGAGAVIEYDHWMRDRDGERLGRIARYNEDDVRATRAVRDWLVAHRPEGLAWRPAVMEIPSADVELDERIERLHAAGAGTPEHLMGDLLGYWRRERRVVAADCLRLSMAAPHEQLESPGVIGGLTFRSFEDRFSAKTGRKRRWPAGVFTFPPQPLDPEITAGSTMILALQEQQWAFFPLAAIDREAGTLEITWNQNTSDQGVMPSSLVHFVTYPEGAKLSALCDLADQMLDGDAGTAGHAILRNDPPAFHPGHGPDGGVFAGGCEEVCPWAPHLDRSYLPVQGPPGTGKTFTGAHLIHTLVKQGRRVGVTAMSHAAIDNLMRAVVEVFDEKGDTLRAVRKASNGAVVGVDYIDDNARCAAGPYDVIAGTPWLFASAPMRAQPVDVLVVDEAGQLGLADTLAASVSATNLVLLGDPQQLPQVAQAAHPNRSGVSALEHLLGEGVHTFPPDRGVLLDVTWRMHPDVCAFISDVMYDGRLTSTDGCSRQSTSAGTGLRWIRAEHDARSTASPEEADIVVSTVKALLGSSWNDHEGTTRAMTVADIIVVTPYNDQRRLLTAALQSDPGTAGIEVGTVDKFQGREAAVVIFSMATSSSEFMPRNADFLFSKNRLNVAISRARCLAYLICTDELLSTPARDVEQMSLISALCSYAERAQLVQP